MTTLTTEQIIEEAILIKGSWAASIRWAIEQEREACAKVCDELYDEYESVCEMTSDLCSQVIRARGNT